MNYELTFETAADAASYFAALDYRRLPVKTETLAAHGRSDDGHKIVTFARRLYRPTLSYSFTEQFTQHAEPKA